MRESGFCCDTDTDDSNTMNKKVRNAQLAQYNFIFGETFKFCIVWSGKRRCFNLNFSRFKVVGEKERTNDTVNVRTRDNKVY